MYKQIKVLSIVDSVQFENECNELLKSGYVMKYVDFNDQWNAVLDNDVYEVDQNKSHGDEVVTVDDVISIVANYFKVKRGDMISGKKIERFVLPRHIAIYITHKYFKGLTFREIGELFGNKHYSTMIHAFDKMKKRINDDDEIANMVNELTFIVFGSKK